ncbi:MAG: metallophosphoesterase family protein, partial [Arcobacteraceae bacterium]|nr:metallophosphoesterase family protein [Arcobacteraceae bacterium]
MKIAVLSDSHKKVELTSQAISFLKLKGASYIIHAGDLEVEENL